MPNLGRFEILDELGRGGMGVVYRAFDPALQRNLAIKVITANDDPDFSARMLREARSAAVLKHPDIVTIYDVGTDNERLYIAMELLEGQDLGVVLKQPPMSFERFQSILAGIASALDYAHSVGIVHRDVKPSNIMVLTTGGEKLMDFGIAKRVNNDGLTRPGMSIGTPQYMAPEQVQGEDVDGRADQFALAVVAYEGLTGRVPFDGDNMAVIIHNLLSARFQDASALNAYVTSTADAVLRKSLSVDPADRYPSCSAFVEALQMSLASYGSVLLPSRSRQKSAAATPIVPRAIAGNSCSTCGAENPADTVFCHNCGSRLQLAATSPTMAVPQGSTVLTAPPPPPPPPAPYPPSAAIQSVTGLVAAAPKSFLEGLPRTAFFSGEQVRFEKVEESFKFFRNNLEAQYKALAKQASLVSILWTCCVGLGFLVLIGGLTAMFFSDGKSAITKGSVTAAGTVLVYYIQRLFQQREDFYRKAAEEKNDYLEYGNKWLLVIQTVDAIQDPVERKRQQVRIATALTDDLNRSPRSPEKPRKRTKGKGKGASA